jgi:hypothetical protein
MDLYQLFLVKLELFNLIVSLSFLVKNLLEFITESEKIVILLYRNFINSHDLINHFSWRKFLWLYRYNNNSLNMSGQAIFTSRHNRVTGDFGMMKNKLIRLTTLLSVFVLLFVAIAAKPASALISQNVTSWFTTSDTSITAVAMGDVNGDGQTEIVTVGYYNDGVRFNAQLAVWNAATMTGLRVMNWNMGSDTQVASVALANITGGIGLDIVTGGSFFDGTRWNSQLIMWNGTTLAGQKVANWYWTGDTSIASIAVANVSRGTSLDVVAGGSFFDGTRWNSQLTVWNASTLAGEKLANWFFTGNTQISSVAIANVTGGTGLEVVTGGSYFDGTRNVAQLIVWNGTTLVGERIVNWFTTSNTKVASVAIGNFTSGSTFDIITGGTFKDGTNRNNAQLVVWNSATLAGKSMMTWTSTSDTEINTIRNGNIIAGAISGNRVVVGGDYYDTVQLNAQLSLWA